MWSKPGAKDNATAGPGGSATPKLAGLGTVNAGADDAISVTTTRGQSPCAGAACAAHCSGVVAVFGRSGAAGTT
jgi:hypothetical protein